MKAELQTAVPGGLSFPLLAKCVNTDDVVLFTSLTIGTLVCPGERSPWPMGHYSEKWVSVDDIEIWYILQPNDRVIITV